MKHHLDNFPECKTCPNFDPRHGSSCRESHDDFICQRVKDHINAIKDELREKRRKESKRMGGGLANYMRISEILGEE